MLYTQTIKIEFENDKVLLDSIFNVKSNIGNTYDIKNLPELNSGKLGIIDKLKNKLLKRNNCKEYIELTDFQKTILPLLNDINGIKTNNITRSKLSNLESILLLCYNEPILENIFKGSVYLIGGVYLTNELNLIVKIILNMPPITNIINPTKTSILRKGIQDQIVHLTENVMVNKLGITRFNISVAVLEAFTFDHMHNLKADCKRLDSNLKNTKFNKFIKRYNLKSSNYSIEEFDAVKESITKYSNSILDTISNIDTLTVPLSYSENLESKFDYIFKPNLDKEIKNVINIFNKHKDFIKTYPYNGPQIHYAMYSDAEFNEDLLSGIIKGAINLTDTLYKYLRIGINTTVLIGFPKKYNNTGNEFDTCERITNNTFLPALNGSIVMYLDDINATLDDNDIEKSLHKPVILSQVIDYINRYKNKIQYIFVLKKPEQVKQLSDILNINILPLYDSELSYKAANFYVNQLIKANDFSINQRLPKSINKTIPSLNNYFNTTLINRVKKTGINNDYIDVLKDHPLLVKDNGDVFNKLDSMIGLEDVKYNIKEICNYFKMQNVISAYGIGGDKTIPSRHMIFKGNPGTAKTSVAKILSDILYSYGVIKTNKFIHLNSSNLIAAYVGQTGIKTKEAIDKGRGGIIFIDEAYSLCGDNDFSKEAIAIIVEQLDLIREDTIVIFAGYPKEMDIFIKSNPGIRSRINFYLEFPDYNEEELLEIGQSLLKSKKINICKNAENKIKTIIKNNMTHKDFGNGRFMRGLIEKSLIRHHSRLSTLDISKMEISEINTIKEEDVVDNKRKEEKCLGFKI